MTITALPPDAGLFAPFGVFIDMPGQVGERRGYSEWLAPVAGLAPHFYTNRVVPSATPMSLTRVERHPHAAQVFLPLFAERYLVVVMPADAQGRPDVSGARAFLVPPTRGVAYHPGVWHAGITALDAEASFAVLMWRGAADDDEFASIPPLEVSAGAARG